MDGERGPSLLKKERVSCEQLTLVCTLYCRAIEESTCDALLDESIELSRASFVLSPARAQ